MSARVHRSEAPIPRAQRSAQRQREQLEDVGQLALDLPQCGGGAGGAVPHPVMIPESPPHTTSHEVRK